MSTRTFDLRIRRVYDPPQPDDGARVLIDRLWPRGLAREAAHLDAWLKTLAPSTELRRQFGHAPERFAEFSVRYRAELDALSDADPGLRTVGEFLAGGRVTLLFAARDRDVNHARVLQDWLEHRLARD